MITQTLSKTTKYRHTALYCTPYVIQLVMNGRTANISNPDLVIVLVQKVKVWTQMYEYILYYLCYPVGHEWPNRKHLQ